MQSFEQLFSNSVWIVPRSTLLAIRTLNNISQEVSDQTIWVIDQYKNGYITGTSYTTINGTPTAKTHIVGSITPSGNVAFSFSSSNNITNGNGTFDWQCCQWMFTMQMNSLATLASEVIGLSHWSYMVKVTPQDYDYHHLPGVDISVPDFIKLFN